jgi:predicted kinase
MRPAILDSIRAGACPSIDALVDALGDDLPALRDFASTPQDPEWHAEGDVHIHTGMVLDELYDDLTRVPATPRDRLCMVLGALLHDIAKPSTTKEMEIRGVRRVAAPRHEPLGRSLLGPQLLAWGLSWAETESVMGLVGYHHEPKLLVQKNRGAGDYRRVSRAVDAELLYRVARADMAGRICTDRAVQVEIVELYRLFVLEYGAQDWFERWRAAFADAGPSEEVRDLTLGEAVRAAEAGTLGSPEAAAHLRFGRKALVPELVVTVGPSGSGKSTWVEKTLVPRGFDVVSLDAIREEMSGAREDQTANGRVRQAARERVKASLRAGRKVVWDATSLRADFRSQVAELGFAYGALVTFVVFARTEASLRTRNRARKSAVPDAVLTKQLTSWEWPERNEAHRMLVVGDSGEVLDFHGGAGDVRPYS